MTSLRRFLTFAAIVAALALAERMWGSIVPDASARQLILLVACNVVVALSLNVINGMAGQFSIGHAGFVGVGAYTGAVVAAHLHQSLGGGDATFARSLVVVPLALVAAGALSGLAGLCVGLPSLRLRGDYLAIVTLGFAEIFRLLLATTRAGDAGAGLFSLARLGGQTGYSGLDPRGVPAYAGPFWVLGVAAVAGLAAWRLKFSGWGRALRALREDEIAAAAVGVDPTRYKVTSFVVAATGAGVAGALLALMRDGTPVVYPETFNFQASFDAVIMVIVGGSGSVTGAALGAGLVTLSARAFEAVQGLRVVRDLAQRWEGLDLNALRMILYASLLIALMILRPEGLLGESELFARRRGAQAGGG